ncbi:MAG: glutaredoxin 3 [Gammaproteobacteria bacterium]
MNIELYTSQTCAFCVNAKALLKQKGLDYSEIDISMDADKASEMVERSGRQTVPQIFIDGKSIGGFAELAKINSDRKLIKS